MITPSEIANSAASSLVDVRYLEAAQDSLNHYSKLLRSLIAQKRLPEAKTPVAVIESLLSQFALMDSNNFPSHAGAGEREGRVYSSIVMRRHFNMSHGIGRSGDLLADQPKAAGSSLMAKLCNALCRDSLHLVGLTQVEKAIVVPSCTGMTLSLVLQYVRSTRPATAKVVVWPRIDQKTCLKCIYTAGLEAHVVELRKVSPTKSSSPATKNKNETVAEGEGPQISTTPDHNFLLRVHPDDVAAAIDSIGAENVVCVLSTTSCFAPRLPDDPLQLARICTSKNIPLVINNAYGIQSPAICRRLNAAFQECGKTIPSISCVQSCDKNFLVPVGGSVLASSSEEFVDKVASLYAGRASADPSTDMFVTLMEMGKAGWLEVQKHRVQVMWPLFTSKMAQFAEKRGEFLILDEKVNDISFAMTLSKFEATTGKTPTWLGGALFRSGISGPRILYPPPPLTSSSPSESSKIENNNNNNNNNENDDDQQPHSNALVQNKQFTKVVAKLAFDNYGMHGLDHSAPPMIVMACAIGMSVEQDVELFMKRMELLYPLSQQNQEGTETAKNKKKKK